MVLNKKTTVEKKSSPFLFASEQDNGNNSFLSTKNIANNLDDHKSENTVKYPRKISKNPSVQSIMSQDANQNN